MGSQRIGHDWATNSPYQAEFYNNSFAGFLSTKKTYELLSHHPSIVLNRRV